MSDRDFRKCSNLLDLYAKLEAMPPKGKIQQEKWMRHILAREQKIKEKQKVMD